MTYSPVFTVNILSLFQDESHANTYIFLNFCGFMFTSDSSVHLECVLMYALL